MLRRIVLGGSSKMSALASHAAAIRVMVAEFDAGGATELAQLRIIVGQVEAIASRLLRLGGCPPELKTEIIEWVRRFRPMRADLAAEKARARHARSLTSPKAPGTKEAPVGKRRTESPYTRQFKYDTSDPRTQDPNFVREPKYMRRARESAERLNLGETAVGQHLAAQLTRVSFEMGWINASAASKEHGTDTSNLESIETTLVRLNAIVETAVLESGVRKRALVELNALGERAQDLRNTATAQRARSRVSVPAELRLTRGGPTVSGGLPTMGRRR